ncbi:MAG: hypothetical protein A2W93_07675 [Bacteroidetes bacterium GWF2_43_63]|nr:MAG: hypothetical protein A2W94_09530 [Bacteroidetes bacterium GWE2_42_42]OFY53048.1 MAG: hypothetical protein A2W93_07675 [Bacteroidetes bacterium GWF2_43_63]HBG69189.1 hypothetical protein [Bacteroidales bacterium]HCB62540.1 hypothetical protein [Bacteroidales bacterium]
MSSYPKIYSISTVGVRQHENADYLLHDVRTDFTGNNGLGKSLIADLLQLIFIPLRDEWKPGTEGLDKDDRKIETIPLERDWISHAYCFLNIEKSKGKFITIGILIPRTSRVPVRPFIVQKGDDFENKKVALKPFEQPLNSEDFIAENLHIYDLTELKRNLKKKHDIYLKDFFQREQVNEYFELLFKNHILPFDLTKEANLKSFAKVLQSFAKAKTLKITDSRSLQNFLFEDDEDIKTTFDNQKEILNQHIRNFHRADQEIKIWERKQELLEHLKGNHETYVKAKESYFSKNAHLLFKNKLEGTKAFEENEKIKNKAFDEYNNAKGTYETQCRESYAKMIEQKEICNEIRSKLEDEQPEAGKQNIEKLKLQLDKNKEFNKRLENLSSVIEQFKTLDLIKSAFDNQEKVKQQKSKLNQLRTCSHYKKFETSKWIDGCESAYEYYNQRNLFLQEKIETLKEILTLYEGKNPDSIFHWAVKQKSALTIEQETVLMAFKEIYIKKIEAKNGNKFSLNPKALLNSYERDGNGIWIVLGEVSEYFELVPKQLFNDKDKLEKAIESDREVIRNEIIVYERELRENRELNAGLIQIGLNQELIDIYINRSQIEEFEIVKFLTEENIQFIEDNFDSFSKLKTLIEESKELDDKITDIIKKTDRIESSLKENTKVLTPLLTDINELKSELQQPIDKTGLNIKEISKEQLVEMRDEREKEIRQAEKIRQSTKKKRDDSLSAFNNAKSQTYSLKLAKESSESNFNIAKRNLEEQTDLQFDELLTLGDITEETVYIFKEEFDSSEKMYQQEYMTVAATFDESKPEKKNPELYDGNGISYYSYQTLENVLCGKIGLSGLTKELNQLNTQLLTLGELQLKILTNVFGLVEKQYKTYEDTVRRLNFFFEKNKVSDAFQFKVGFESRKDINIDWIEKMKARGRVHKEGADLFTLPEDFPSNENTPENLIRNIAKKFYGSVNADTSQLLNPKFYFSLKVRMEDEKGKKNTGSGGQAYTALALLCIGRLSIVQKYQEINQGVKFIIIEELSNIDDTNFNIFPDIAKQFGYQLLTMTPKPFGSYTNDEWYLHMLVKGKQDKDRNYTPMSFFKTKFRKVELDKHIQEQNEVESIKTT